MNKSSPKLISIQIFILCITIFFISSELFAQNDSAKILLKGKIVGETNLPVANAMVVNKTTQHGIFADAENTFSIEVLKNDTLLIAATGYSIKKICFRDSLLKQQYDVVIHLGKIIYELKPVTIISPREIETIQKDIEKLGYNKNDYMLSGIDAFQSPITFLYQAFSRRERNKRLIAEKRNEDRKRELLKELFRKYVDGNIIKLSEEDFDKFIDFCDVNDEYLKKSSQYDFIMFIKQKYDVYALMRK